MSKIAWHNVVKIPMHIIFCQIFSWGQGSFRLYLVMILSIDNGINALNLKYMTCHSKNNHTVTVNEVVKFVLNRQVKDVIRQFTNHQWCWYTGSRLECHKCSSVVLEWREQRPDLVGCKGIRVGSSHDPDSREWSPEKDGDSGNIPQASHTACTPSSLLQQNQTLYTHFW